MRKTVFLFIATLFLGSFVYSQNTTVEEYNYIKSGILVQMRTGLDVQKQGYTLYDITTITKDVITFHFKGLERSDESNAGIWVLIDHHHANQEWTLCIPFNNPHLINLYENDVKEIFNIEYAAQAYANALTELLALIVTLPDSED